MGNALVAGAQLVFIAALTGRVAGDAATDVIRSLGNREQEVVIGNHVPGVTYDISIRAPAAAGTVEVCYFKADRKENVPVIGTILPSAANIVAVGLQQAMRMAMPGQILKFKQFAVTIQTSRSVTDRIGLVKFKKSKMRAGDFIGFVINNRTSGTFTVDIQTRYKELS